jgi:ribonuclease HI
MDLTYVTIPIFGGEHRIFYREVGLAYILSDHQNPSNHPIHLLLYFYGSSSKEGYGVGIVLISPSKEVVSFSYKLEFEKTNNITEYEALVLGLKASKDMAIEKLAVFIDSELFVNQVKDIFQEKQLSLNKYKNEVWDIVENLFLSFNISFVPRNANKRGESLALFASTFMPPIGPNVKYEVEVRHITTILDNVKH